MSAIGLSTKLAFPLLSLLLFCGGTYRRAKTDAQSLPSNAETAKWRNYRNQKYGFELKYPPGFEVSEDHAGYIVFKPPNANPRFGLSVSLLRQRGKLTLDEFVHDDTAYEEDQAYSFARESIISRDGMTIYRFQRILGSSTRQGRFFLKDQNRGTMADYLIEYDRCNGGGCGPGVSMSDRILKNPFTKQYDQILATFRFVEPEAAAGDQ